MLGIVLEEFDAWRRRLEDDGLAPVRDAWKARSITLDTVVRVAGITGRAIDLDETGALVIDDGSRRHRVVAGELVAEATGAARH